MEAADAKMSQADEEDRSQEHHDGHGSHHHHHGHGHHHEEPMSPQEAIRSLLVLGQVALNADDYVSAVDAYASALQIGPDVTAAYNLGSLYARGLGVRRDYVEGARLFHQAELLGNERARRLCGKCMLDYVSEGIDDRSPADLYAAMAVFVSRVYPEAEHQRQEVNSGLFSIGSTLLDKGDHARAAKAFRAAAEFGNDGFAQYYVGLLYSNGAGLGQSDLAALYWLDRAVDNGAADVALESRDGILGAYRQSLSDRDFREMMETLADWCDEGTSDVPADSAKAKQWRELA